jgi:hypothetical protein
MQSPSSNASARAPRCDLLRHLLGAHTSVSRGWRTVAIVVAVGALSVALYFTDAALERQHSAAEDSGELVYVPPARFLKLVAIGYQQTLADVLWFRTLNYFGRHYQSDRVYRWLEYMCNVVTDLDPQAEHVYRFGGVLLPWEADQIDEGIALLEKGVQNIPQSWRLQYMLGFSYYFFRNDLAAASRVLKTAALQPGAPEYISAFAALISAAHHGPSDAIDFLAEIDRGGTGNELHNVMQQRIGELTMTGDIDALDAGVKRFQAQYHRLPADLSELVSTNLISALPREPFGGTYILNPQTGHVESTSGHKPWRLSSSKTREAFLTKSRQK